MEKFVTFSIKIVQWDIDKKAIVVHSLHNSKVISLALSSDSKVLFSLDFDLNLIGFEFSSNSKLFELKLKNGEIQSIQGSRTNPQVVYALLNNCLLTINNGKLESDNSFSFEARSLAVSETEFYIGDRV
jgi:hypothetical protein